MNQSIVYVVRCNNLYKIGRTSNFPKRLKQLQTGNPNLIEPIRIYKTEDATGLEKYLHSVFKGSNVRLEWYKIKSINSVDKHVDKFIPSDESKQKYKEQLNTDLDRRLQDKRHKREKNSIRKILSTYKDHKRLGYCKYLLDQKGLLYACLRDHDILSEFNINGNDLKLAKAVAKI